MISGRGIPGVEDQDNWHGKPVGDKGLAELRAKLVNPGPIKLCVQPAPHDVPMCKMAPPSMGSPPAYKLGEKVRSNLDSFYFLPISRWPPDKRTARLWQNSARLVRKSLRSTATRRTALSQKRSKRRIPIDTLSVSLPNRILSAWLLAVRRVIGRFRFAGFLR
jgi:hypothetical protein